MADTLGMAGNTMSLSGSGSTTVTLATDMSTFKWSVAGKHGAPNPASTQPFNETVTVDLVSKVSRKFFWSSTTTWKATFTWNVSVPLTLTWSSS